MQVMNSSEVFENFHLLLLRISIYLSIYVIYIYNICVSVYSISIIYVYIVCFALSCPICRGSKDFFHLCSSKCFIICLFSVDSASTVPGLLSIFHEQEMTETVHDTKGQGYLATLVGKNGR